MSLPSVKGDIVSVHATTATFKSDYFATEEPLEIRIVHGTRMDRRERAIAVTMRTPGNDPELAVGFLYTEGILRDVEDILNISETETSSANQREELAIGPQRNSVTVELNTDVAVKLAALERNFYMTSSCGICGKASILALEAICPPRRLESISVESSVLYSLVATLRGNQQLFDDTGGLHAAGLFSREGQLLSAFEDVGRHNAVDKLIGAAVLRDSLPLRNCILLLSGRASFELMQKAAMSGIGMVVSVSAPSSLAIQVAKRLNLPLIGFLRTERFNIYHGETSVLGLHTSPGEEG